MTPDPIGPFSRPIPLHRVKPEGLHMKVEANEAERAALAADLGIPAIDMLKGEFELSGTTNRVRVKGRITADIVQTCVVTLDEFGSVLEEDVDVEFQAPRPERAGAVRNEVELDLEHDPPDELVGERIDLGAITSEFLALSLDPYPKKPGVVFEPSASEEGESPFAALASLRANDEKA